MNQRRRACLRCGGRIGGEKRSDALYCSNVCRQAAYHARGGLPVERWRSRLWDVLPEFEDLPSFDEERPIFNVAYKRSTQCMECSEVIQHDDAPDEPPMEDYYLKDLGGVGLILQRPRGDIGPCCSDECLIEFAHRRQRET